MEFKGTRHNRLQVVELPLVKVRRGVKRRPVDPRAVDVYEVRPREDGDGFDLISDRLRRGPIWYAGPDAVRKAVAYAKYRSWARSCRAVIRVLDQCGTVIEAH
ncbi:MAG: hypothetical protein J2P56_07705 [Verrucomicrobia bacterium]|nr:hypothetical protein [Verrucomicrobiota bacterium]